jgi:putative hydrolase of the HAD superfamily
VLRAILFDWGNTLVRWDYDDELLAEGHARGLAAIGGSAPASREAFSELYNERVVPPLIARREDEVDYPELVRQTLAAVGVDTADGAVDRFVEAEHAVWRLAHTVQPGVLELLDELHARGLTVGLVSNLFDPPHLIRGTFAQLGVLERLDAVALSAEVGKRKPHPEIFRHALAELGVPASDAVHVGDRVREDVGGAAAVGLRTIQATWFLTDDATDAVPDARASTPAEVLEIVERWHA